MNKTIDNRTRFTLRLPMFRIGIAGTGIEQRSNGRAKCGKTMRGRGQDWLCNGIGMR